VAYGGLGHAGPGGAGPTGGGAGGNVTSLQVDAPQNPYDFVDGFDSISAIILAGNGGNGTGAAAPGGIGGTISQVSETKDINSSINLLQAGNGGVGTTTGGLGGSVTTVKTVGLIGQASDDAGNRFGVFQTAADPSGVLGNLFPAGVPEGAFAGRGGAGSTNGLDGSVTSISAYEISAIGAAANASGVFAAANKIASITAEYIGFSATGASSYQGVSPGTAEPTDGFIFSVVAPTGISGTVLTGAEFHS